jgi:hypothetical protein
MHVGLLVLVSRPVVPDLAPAGRPPRTVEVFVVPPPPPEDATFAGLNPIESPGDRTAFPLPREQPRLVIDSFEINILRIGRRAKVLFPFLTPGLSLDLFGLGSRPRLDERLANPLLQDPDRLAALNRPLALDDAALQALVDKSWSRRDRWSKFQPLVALAHDYSPDAGRLSEVFRHYREQNWMQPYEDATIRDPRLWAELGLAADHVDFIGFIRQYVSAHPSTRTSTELLFLLDDIAQASRNLLGTLLETDPATELLRTRAVHPRAHALVSEIRRYYQDELTRQRLTPDLGVSAYYDQVRIKILTGIVSSAPGGYRVNDARFLLGTIYWRQKKFDEALRWWAQITGDRADRYFVTYSEMLPLFGPTNARVAPGSLKIDAKLTRQVNRVLDNDYGRWLVFSVDRLRKFGYRIDTF